MSGVVREQSQARSRPRGARSPGGETGINHRLTPVSVNEPESRDLAF